LAKPESFDNIEDKFKLTLLQIEKRFVDLEMSISELKAKLKDINFDAITSLQQRVDDLENLAMVENVGVIELKKMLDGIKTQFGDLPAAVSKISPLEERLNKLEASISETPAKPDTTGLEQKIEKLNNDIAQLMAKPTAPEVDLSGLHSGTQTLKEDLNNLKMTFDQTVKTFDARIKEVVTRPPEKSGADFDFFNSRLESLKTGIDLLSDKKVETDLKFAGVEEKINILDNRIREALSQKFVDEIKLNKRDIMTSGLRIESVERVVKELTNELNELNKTVKKFENFERLTILNKDVEEKLQRLKFIEDQTSRLSSRIEIIYDDLNSRFSGIGNMGNDVKRVSEIVANLNKEIGKNKIEVEQRVKKEDFDQKFNEMQKKMSENGNFLKKEEVYGRLSTSDRKITEIEKLIVNARPVNVDEIKAGLDGMNKQMADINGKVVRLNKEVADIIVDKGKSGGTFDTLVQRINTIEGRIGNLYQITKGAKPQEVKLDDTRFSKIFSQLSVVEDRMRNMEKNIKLPEATVFDEQIEELLGKLVFVESRMAAIERTMQETKEVNPIILE
jgi:uncharacterized protein YoxC